MNRRASSLIAVRDGADEQANRYLTYYDQQWECWFLPNHSSSGSYEEDKTKLIGYMTSEFKIPSDAFDVKFVGTSTTRNGPRSIKRNAHTITGCIWLL